MICSGCYGGWCRGCYPDEWAIDAGKRLRALKLNERELNYWRKQATAMKRARIEVIARNIGFEEGLLDSMFYRPSPEYLKDRADQVGASQFYRLFERNFWAGYEHGQLRARLEAAKLKRWL